MIKLLKPFVYLIRRPLERIDRASRTGPFILAVSVWIALILATVHLGHDAVDNVPNHLIPVSILREANVELGEFNSFRSRLPEIHRYWGIETDSGLFSMFPIWTGVLVTPFFLPFARQLPSMDMLSMETLHRWFDIGRAAAWICCGLTGGLIAAAARRYVPNRWSVVLAFFSVFGTGIWLHAGSQLSNQTVSLLLVTLLLYLAVDGRMSKSRALAFGLLSGLAVSARLPTCFITVALMSLFLFRRAWRPYLGWAVGTLLFFPLLTLIYNHYAFGHCFTTGYVRDVTNPGARFTRPVGQGLFELYLSPTSGLFFYSPFALFAVPSIIRFIRKESGPRVDRTLIGLLCLGMAGQSLLFSMWGPGTLRDWSYGDRWLIEIIPGLIFLLSAAWSPLIGRAPYRKLFVMAGLLSIFWYFVGTFVHTVPVEKSLWDLRKDFLWVYIEQNGLSDFLTNFFLRGFCFALAVLCFGYIASGLLAFKPDGLRRRTFT